MKVKCDDEEEKTLVEKPASNVHKRKETQSSYKRSKTVADPRVAEAYDIKQSLKQKVTERDECSVYGEQLAFKLRVLDQQMCYRLKIRQPICIFPQERLKLNNQVLEVPVVTQFAVCHLYPLEVDKPHSGFSTYCDPSVVGSSSEQPTQLSQGISNFTQTHDVQSQW